MRDELVAQTRAVLYHLHQIDRERGDLGDDHAAKRVRHGRVRAPEHEADHLAGQLLDLHRGKALLGVGRHRARKETRAAAGRSSSALRGNRDAPADNLPTAHGRNATITRVPAARASASLRKVSRLRSDLGPELACVPVPTARRGVGNLAFASGVGQTLMPRSDSRPKPVSDSRIAKRKQTFFPSRRFGARFLTDN